MMYTLLLILILLSSTHLFAKEENTEEDNPQDPAPEAPLETSQDLPSLPGDIRSVPNIEVQKANALTTHFKTLREEELTVWLGEEGAEFLAIYGMDNTGSPQGALIILHDESHQPEWPIIITPLRKELPNFGWATLSLSIPNTERQPLLPRPIKTIPEPEKESDKKESSKSKDKDKNTASPENNHQEENSDFTPLTPEEVKAIIHHRLDLAIRYINSQGYYNLALSGFGVGAAWAANYLASRFPAPTASEEDPDAPPEKGFGLILVDAKNPEHNPQILTEKSLEKIHFPVLDLIQEHSSVSDRAAQKRKAHANRFLRKQYLQLRLPPKYNHLSKKDRIAKRVRGWLKVNMAGKEVTIDN